MQNCDSHPGAFSISTGRPNIYELNGGSFKSNIPSCRTFLALAEAIGLGTQQYELVEFE
jgi:hypothetical protein